MAVRQMNHPGIDAMTIERVLQALGDPVRLTIVRSLRDGSERLASDFDVPVAASTLSHHMRTLREAGILRSRPEGTRCYISLRPELDTRFPGLLDAVMRQR
jgi:DNA-binding transcriptional ArsR family regulator